MTETNKNSVVMCFDSAYASAACVTLASLFLNSGDTEFQVDLLQTSSNPTVDRALAKLATTFNRVINQHEVNEHVLDDFHISNHISPTTYLRFFIPDYVQATKAVYLDCDLIVQCDIGELFAINLDAEDLIAGAEDLVGGPYAKPRLGISDTYINAGVLLLDVKRWRKEKIKDRLINYYRANVDKITWHDQCVINGALTGHKKVIAPKFNMLLHDLENQARAIKNFTAAQFEGVFHYNSTTKPWHAQCAPRYKALWDKYAAVAPISPQELPATDSIEMSIQELRRKFVNREIGPFDWLGDSPMRFDDYTRYAAGCKRILELGVYTGLSTAAWLMAEPESLVSIDITDEYFSLRPSIEKIARDMGIDYQFLKMNDLDYKSTGHDLLFIDTTHTFEQTIQELNNFGQFTSKRIVMHDMASHPGVYQAVFQWLWENKNFRIIEHDSRGNGVVVMERYKGI